jgi:hypothetical protein
MSKSPSEAAFARSASSWFRVTLNSESDFNPVRRHGTYLRQDLAGRAKIGVNASSPARFESGILVEPPAAAAA